MSSQETHIDGDVGPVLSGSFGGPVQTGQSVIVTVQQAAQAELPPELQNATLRQMTVGVIAAVQNLEDRIYYAAREDAQERQKRQEEADQHRRAVRTWLIALTFGVVLSLVFNAAWAWVWQTRFGWLW